MSINVLLDIDGAIFVLIGIVVIVNPSPQPTLVDQVDSRTIVPFEDTRRLVASQFIGNGLLAVLVGMRVHDVNTLKWAATARIAMLVTVIAVNASQLRRKAWKPSFLYGIIASFSFVIMVYTTLIVAT